MGEVVIVAKGEEETAALGEYIGKRATENLFLALSGELGAGKTHFVQGLAKGLGVRDTVTSPTFTIMNMYEGRLPLKHFDFYRLTEEEELYSVGWDEYSVGGVTVAEWADRFPAAVPVEGIRLRLEKTDECTRIIYISWSDKAPEEMTKEIMGYVARA